MGQLRGKWTFNADSVIVIFISLNTAILKLFTNDFFDNFEGVFSHFRSIIVANLPGVSTWAEVEYILFVPPSPPPPVGLLGPVPLQANFHPVLAMDSASIPTALAFSELAWPTNGPKTFAFINSKRCCLTFLPSKNWPQQCIAIRFYSIICFPLLIVKHNSWHNWSQETLPILRLVQSVRLLASSLISR